jgi:hypothetical protein
MRLRKPKDKTEEFARAREGLRQEYEKGRPETEGPDVVPVEHLRTYGVVELPRVVEIK